MTRIRPDKLLDLEEDNYSNFPSMSYAKGFLLLYARFLGVDVRDFADTLHAPNPVSSSDYEYLSAGATSSPAPTSRRPYHFSRRRERTTLLPIVVFGVLAGAVVLAVYLIVTIPRLGNLDDLGDKSGSPAASPAISTLPQEGMTPALRNSPPALVAASPIPAPPIPSSPPSAGQAPPGPAAKFDPTREVRRAEEIPASPPAQANGSPGALPPVGSGPAIGSIAPVATPEAVKRISIRPIRKTMVTIRKDVAGSVPVFEDWLYPSDGPLKLSGHKFWIRVQDPTAVEITQDGQPLPGGQREIQIE